MLEPGYIILIVCHEVDDVDKVDDVADTFSWPSRSSLYLRLTSLFSTSLNLALSSAPAKGTNFHF